MKESAGIRLLCAKEMIQESTYSETLSAAASLLASEMTLLSSLSEEMLLALVTNCCCKALNLSRDLPLGGLEMGVQ